MREPPKGAKVVSAGAAPIRLELGSQGCGEDLAQRPIPARPWHEEVGLGVIEHNERDRANLDHILPVQCDLSEDPRRGLFRPGLVEEEVADAVKIGLPSYTSIPLGQWAWPPITRSAPASRAACARSTCCGSGVAMYSLPQ